MRESLAAEPNPDESPVISDSAVEPSTEGDYVLQIKKWQLVGFKSNTEKIPSTAIKKFTQTRKMKHYIPMTRRKTIGLQASLDDLAPSPQDNKTRKNAVTRPN